MKTFNLLKQRFAKSILLQLSFICIAFLFVAAKKYKQQQFHFNKYSSFSQCKISIDDEPEVKTKSVKTKVKVEAVFSSNQKQITTGYALVYFQKNEKALALKQGDILFIPNNWNAIKNNGNPGEFDYKQYCSREQLYQIQFVPSGYYKVTGHTFSLNSYFQSISSALRSKIAYCIPDTNAQAFATALLLGYRKNLDSEVYQDYANTGLMHLIAISGMHIGMIYFTLLQLLLLLPFLEKRKKAPVILALLSIWFFACLTGLPPSVLRSTLMFTMLGLGSLGEHKISIYNNLCCSAFILLCINPDWLWDIGFQLSYAAVFSIAVFFKKIYNSIYLKNRSLDFIWKSISTTIAAQIFTMPLCLYYFHQFPLLFIINNLIGIFFTTIILYAEIIMLALLFFPKVALWLGKLITLLINYLNYIVHKLGAISFVRIQGVQLNFWQLLFLVLSVIGFSIFLFEKKIKYLQIACVLFALFCCFGIVEKIKSTKQARIIVFNIKNKTSLGIIHGNTFSSFSDTTFTPEDERYVFEPAKHYFRAHQLGSREALVEKNSFYTVYYFRGNKIIYVKQKGVRWHPNFKPDVIIISKTALYDNEVVNCAQTSDFILEPSINAQNATKWEARTVKKAHILKENGAFIRSF